MASVESPKRPHVKTERMQEYLNNNGDIPISPQKLLRCPKEGCDKVLTSSPGLRYHLKSHEQERPYICRRCQKTFKSSNGLKYHTEKTKCEVNLTFPSFELPVSSPASLLCKSSMQSVRRSLTPSLQCEEECLPFDDDEDDIEVISHIKSRYIPPPLSITTTSDLVSHFETRNALSPLSHLETTESTYVNSSPDHSHVDVVSNGNSQINWLAELAEIATGPKSPLLQKTRPSPTKSPTKTFLEHSLHSYARPPKSPTTPSDAKETSATKDVVRSLWDESDSRVTSSSPFPASPVEDSNSFSGNWSHSWPTAVWQCFIQGTRLRFTSGPRTEWQLAEELANKEFLAAQAAISQEDSERKSYAPNGLKLLHIEECQPTLSKPDAYMRLRFSSDVDSQPEIIAECALDHPFFIRDKGWSSFHPGLTAEHFGIPCSELEVGDLCLPQSHPDATFTTDVFESFKCYDFTPMDSSAVFALSNMAKIRRDQELSPKSSPTTSPSRKKSSKPDSPTKAKRPMNAFMLFAKKFRVEYTHMYPGKDNRAISCLLGERWKKLKNEERRIYAAEAKLLAEQHKKIHPDCWKRKRSASQGSGE